MLTALLIPSLNVTVDGDGMRNCWRSLFYKDKYLTTKTFALTDVFGTENVRNNSVFGKEYWRCFLARSAELQLPYVIASLKRTKFEHIHFQEPDSHSLWLCRIKLNPTSLSKISTSQEHTTGNLTRFASCSL